MAFPRWGWGVGGATEPGGGDDKNDDYDCSFFTVQARKRKTRSDKGSVK